MFKHNSLRQLLPFAELLQNIKHLLWLFGETVLTQLFQLAETTEKIFFYIKTQKKN